VTTHFSTACGNFSKIDKKSFLNVVTPIKDLFSASDRPDLRSLSERLTESRWSDSTSYLMLPSSDKKEVFIRNAVLNDLRTVCVDLLNTLPAKQDATIRHFLVNTENFAQRNAEQNLKPICPPRNDALQPAF
jgi:hypothetical protein